MTSRADQVSKIANVYLDAASIANIKVGESPDPKEFILAIKAVESLMPKDIDILEAVVHPVTVAAVIIGILIDAISQASGTDKRIIINDMRYRYRQELDKLNGEDSE